MSNHSIDCPICGEDLRGLGSGHDANCPWSGTNKFYGTDHQERDAKQQYYRNKQQVRGDK